MTELKQPELSVEEQWAQAAKRGRSASAEDALRPWSGMMVSGLIAVVTFFGVFMYWPATHIPVLVLVGLPILLGGGVHVGMQRLLGGDVRRLVQRHRGEVP